MNSRLIKQTLLTATLITVGGNILGRFFGYFREALVAKIFGTSAILDTFLVAFTIPELLTFVIYAAIPSAVISSSAKLAGDSNDRQHTLFRKGLVWFGLSLVILTTLLYLFKDQILIWLAPELNSDLTHLAGRLYHILIGVLFFRGAESYFRAWLFKRKHFVVPAMSPLILNTVIITSLLIAPDQSAIIALAYGWLVASVMLFLVQAITALTIMRPSGVTSDTVAVSPMLKMALVVAAIEAAFLIFPAIDRYLALKYLGEGEIAALRYAFFVSQLPPGMLVVTFSAVAFPWITDLAAQIAPDQLRRFYIHSVRMILYIMLPVVAGLLFFSRDIVQIAFQRGAFDQTSVELTTVPLICYSLGLIFYSGYFYQIRYYYARQLLTRLGLILAVSLIVKLVASMLLIGPFGHSGLALATSIAWLSSFLMMTIDLNRMAGLSFTPGLGQWGMRVLPAIALTVLLWWGTTQLWVTTTGWTLSMRAVRLVATGLSGLAVYWSLSYFLRLPEALKLADTVRRRFRRS